MTIRNQLLSILFLIFVLPLVFIFNPGCAKEYSYERVLKQDSILLPDSTKEFSVDFPFCKACDSLDNISASNWNFKNGNSFLCGIIDTAILNSERNAFTFFGPSACSVDTGMVITVYLNPISLDKDRFNITTERVAFYYYDNVKPSYILESRPTHRFSLEIESYIHQTGILTGKFSGYVFTEDSLETIISQGKFKLKFD